MTNFKTCDYIIKDILYKDIIAVNRIINIYKNCNT